MFRTAIKNNKLYIRATDTGYAKPEIVDSYWLTAAPAYPELDNLPVYEMGGAKFIKAFGKEIPVNPVDEYPEFTEFTPMPKPRGKYTWRDGEWRKG